MRRRVALISQVIAEQHVAGQGVKFEELALTAGQGGLLLQDIKRYCQFADVVSRPCQQDIPLGQGVWVACLHHERSQGENNQRVAIGIEVIFLEHVQR